MTYDSESFRRRAASLPGDQTDDIEVAGHLALALAALERRRRSGDADAAPSAGDGPILLQD
jgi:hypothetical protein